MRIVLIDGHPDANRLTSHLLDEYQRHCGGAAQIDRLVLRDMDFDPVLHKGYVEPQSWEPDLLHAARLIDACDHMVFAFPMWWGAEPALLKGFVDRVLLPHFTFRYHDNDSFWDGLLAGRSADALVTLDTPPIFLRFAYGNSIMHRWRKQILGFCGLKPARLYLFGPVRRGSAEKKMAGWHRKLARAAQKAAAASRSKKLHHLEDFLNYRAGKES
ncbi:MAG: NAD(P)H-dependent oxidoreductase [Pseudomonadota bacterium]